MLKDISADDLINCIRDVLAGKTYLAPAAAAKLAEGVTRVQLTPREMATLKLLADGKANKEIATALDISERTVKTHLAHLFEKLGVTSRTEAVKVATRRGLVRLSVSTETPFLPPFLLSFLPLARRRRLTARVRRLLGGYYTARLVLYVGFSTPRRTDRHARVGGKNAVRARA